MEVSGTWYGRGLLALIEIEGNGTPASASAAFPFASALLDSNLDVPPGLREDFDEAASCLGLGCFKASMVMSRRALQRTLASQGCEGRLVDAIDAALERGILRPLFHDLAHEVREYGNLSAHPDDGQLANANAESARQILEFARVLIHEFYEVPAAVQRLRANREDR